MSRFANVTTDDVLRAARVLDHTPHKPTKYEVVIEGVRYPSKAILAIAADTSPCTFSGGFACTIPVLQRLGFTIMHGLKVVPPRKVKDAARKAAKAVPARKAPSIPESVTWFLSGTNRAGEIAGVASQGHAVGCAAPEISMASEDALANLADTGIQVFIDSGAFSEVTFTDDGPVVVREITPDRWAAILDLYERLARVLGSQLHVVAPDRVGDQEHTLALAAEHGFALRRIAGLGANILIPCQKGRLSQMACFNAYIAQARLSSDFDRGQVRPALPCNKAATTPLEAQAFAGLNPHLLGVGPRSTAWAEYLCALGNGDFTCDSAWIPSATGRTNGRGNGPRAYTAAKDAAKLILGIAAPAFVVAHTALHAALSVAL